MLKANQPRFLLLWGLFGLQLLCALFFLADAVADLLGYDHHVELPGSDLFEGVIVIVLLCGLVLSGIEINRMMGRQRRTEAQLQAASGAFVELLETSFEAWGLTPSECDVALLSIKGMSIAEIAAARQTKEGTIKAQSNAIYRKAGVTGRLQLLSLFIEGLMGEGLVPGDRGPATSTAG